MARPNKERTPLECLSILAQGSGHRFVCSATQIAEEEETNVDARNNAQVSSRKFFSPSLGSASDYAKEI